MVDESSRQITLMVVGGVAGSVAKTAVAPFERLRIMAQTGNGSKSMFGTARVILDKEGPVGLWRGNLVNCLRVFPSRGILFSCNDYYKLLLVRTFMNDSYQVRDGTVWTEDGMPVSLPSWISFGAGSIAGMTACGATYPLDVARTRMTGRIISSGKEGRLFHTLASMAKQEGFRSWYRGIWPTLLGSIPYEGVKFSVYDACVSSGSPLIDPSNSVLLKLTSGAIGGAAAGLFMFPNDTVRRLMQMEGRGGQVELYKNSLDCYRKLYKSEGVARFYKGLVPYLVRMAPNSAIQFTVYETLKSKLL